MDNDTKSLDQIRKLEKKVDEKDKDETAIKVDRTFSFCPNLGYSNSIAAF